MLLLLAHATWMWLTVSSTLGLEIDDAYITLRYSRHLATGHGIVWNVGEPPLEGYSNFLHVLIGAICLRLSQDPISSLKCINLACLILFTPGLTYAIARTYVTRLPALFVALATAAYTDNVFWAASGMETALYQALVVASFASAIRAMGFRSAQADARAGPLSNFPRKWSIIAALFAVLAAMSRSEGAIAGLVILSVMALSAYKYGSQWRQAAGAFLLPFAALFLSLFGLYFAWRWHYFGDMLPQPVHCKSKFYYDAFQLHKSYLKDVWPLILLGLLMPLRQWDNRAVLLGGFFLAYATILIAVDPVMAFRNRHFLCTWPLVCVWGGVGLFQRISQIHAPLVRQSLKFAAIAVPSLLFAITGERQLRDLSGNAQGMSQRYRSYPVVAQWIASTIPEQEAILIGEAGIIPYLTHRNFIDTLCLNNRDMSLPSINYDLGLFAGHVFQSPPGAMILPSRKPDQFIPLPANGWDGSYLALASRPEFQSLYTVAQVFPNPNSHDFSLFAFIRKDLVTGGME